MRPILLVRDSANHTDVPSGPATIPSGLHFAVGMRKAPAKLPLVETRPMVFTVNSVNQRLPSGPAAIPYGPQPAEDPHVAIRGN
jgi:hypothetical protein